MAISNSAYIRVLLLVCGLGLAVSMAHGQERPARAASDADLLITNARVWTVNPEQPWAEAIAIVDGRITAVGSTAEIVNEHTGPQTRVLNLNGAFALPGFNDNHIHFQSAASFHEFNIMRTTTQDGFVARMRSAVERIPKGEWITGGFWGAYDQWAFGSAGGEQREPFTPDMRLVAELTAGHPVFIRKFDNSEFAINRQAMRELGIDPDDPELRDMTFVRDDQSGEITGIIPRQSSANYAAVQHSDPANFARAPPRAEPPRAAVDCPGRCHQCQ